MSNFNMNPSVSTNEPSIPPIETNYVVRHDPVAVAPPPPPAPQLPLSAVLSHAAPVLVTQPRKPPPHAQAPKFSTDASKLPKLIPTQQHRPIAQYNRPRILARGPANGNQAQVRQYKAIGLSSPAHGPSSPASPIAVPVSNSAEATELAELQSVMPSVSDTNSSGSMNLESIYMATVGTAPMGNQNQAEATFGNQVLCQPNSTVQPTTHGIRLNLLPVVENSQQIQFPMSDIGVFQLIGLPMSMPATALASPGSNLLGVSGGLQPQLITQNSALTYALDMNEEQQTEDAISRAETETAIQGLEEYLMASSPTSGNETDSISMTGQMSSAATAEEVGEDMDEFVEPSVMTFEDFSDLIRGLPMDPTNIMPSSTLDQVQSSNFQASPQSITSNPMNDGSIPIEEMDTQPLFVLNDRDSNLETTAENQEQQLSLEPEMEPQIPTFDPASETIEAIPTEPVIEENESPAMDVAAESIPEIQPSIQLLQASAGEIPTIEKSSEESPLDSESEAVAVAPHSDSGIDLSLPEMDSEASEAKLEPEVIPCEDAHEAKDGEAVTPSEIILEKKPQEFPKTLTKEAVKEVKTNGTGEYEDVKLEADEELESSTTEMSPTDSTPDSDAEKLVIVESIAEEEAKPVVEDVKPVLNGVKVKTETTVDEPVPSSPNTTLDPTVFSNRSTKLIWENGIGTFPGTGLKFRVNPVTGVLETCESSLVYLRSVKQDENKPLKKPMLNSTNGKKNFLPLAMNKAKNNPIIGMARTQTNKNLAKKQIGATKKKATSSEAGQKEAPKEDLNVSKIKAEPKEEEGDDEESTLTAEEIEESISVSPEKKTASCSTKKTPPASTTASPVKPKNKPGRKPNKPNPSPVPTKAEESESEPSNPKLVFAKKSAPIPVLPVLPEQVAEMASFTVVPILQSSPVGSPEVAESEDEPEEETKVERQRRGRPPKIPMVSKEKKLKKRRKKVTVEHKLKMKQVANRELRKRNFEKVLSTRTQHYNNAAQAADSAANTTGTESYASSGNEEFASAPSPQSSSAAGSGKEKAGPVMIEFVWSKYLLETNSKGAPPRLFRQPAFPPPNPFKAGMMLEAIDPQHQSLCCVASIVDIQGYRLCINITGYSNSYNFWVNADSYEIFPAGWCEENGHKLEAPLEVEPPFNWHKYLIDEQKIAADRNFFAISKEDPVMNSDVLVGMKLEAVDIREPSLICVATIAQVINDRFLVHFDSWDTVYDYWTDATSPFIHPVGWCSKNGANLVPPNTIKSTEEFIWEKYLQQTKSIPMPSHLFRPLPPISFKKGMKLECVDKRNPYLIRVATIAEVEGHQLTIHFDHWPTIYDYEVYECSPDIHPVGWCAATGHTLQAPPPNCTASKPWNGACSTYGCLGIGHVKGPKFLTHNIAASCPYAPANLNKDLLDFVPDRVITFEQNLSMIDTRRDSSGLSPVKTREKRKLESEDKDKSEKLQQKKSDTCEVPAKIAKRKSTARKSDVILPSSSESPLRESTEEMTITSEPIPESDLTMDTLRKTKLTYRPVAYGSWPEESDKKFALAEKDKLTIETVPMPEDLQGTSTETTQATSSKVALALLRKNLTLKRKSEKPISPKPKRHYSPRGAKAKATPLHVGPVLPEKLTTTTSGLILPKIESTITACPPPGLTPAPGRTYQTWDETIDSVVRACLRKASTDENQGTSEFQLPPSTTMTPINVPSIQPLSIQTQDTAPKQDNSMLLMMIPTQAGGAATTHTVSNSLVATPVPTETTTAVEPGAKPRSRAGSTCEDVRARKSSQISPFQSPLTTHGEQDSDLPFNYAHNILPFQDIVGKLCQNDVTKWMTKDVADFVARIPGCISAGRRFTEQMIDGEAFLLMTQNDLLSIMGLGMGHSLKIAHAIRLIHSNSNGTLAFLY